MTFFSVGLESRLQVALYERKMSLTKGDGDGTPSSLDGNGYGCGSGLGTGDGYGCGEGYVFGDGDVRGIFNRNLYFTDNGDGKSS
jgi:hypothetical protein